ncbi:hypothetical protein [Nocardioides panaciterrulae]|uniref:Uncharacterized protein n=1 Tax=Nocardioides panaciterrulae TaxID=661492 RepID=A0A7Y9E3N1_9ACTN|nr:hypothetical protein [Nocardioides panaciterrulae]NYD40455.1 hypothetical protein [Nocardioides panaciterrulae]
MPTTRTRQTRRTCRADGGPGGLALAAIAALITGLIAGVLVGGSGPASGAAPDRPAGATRVVRLSPVTGDGALKPGWRVATRRSGGTCSRGSEALGAGAYRCFAGNTVFDPCWAQHDGHHVVCAASPWRRVLARVRARHLHPAPGPTPNVWGIRLASGRECTFLQGASSVHHGERISYACGGRLYLYGEPDRSTARWTIGAVTYRHGHWRHDHPVRIARAVLGRPSPAP